MPGLLAPEAKDLLHLLHACTQNFGIILRGLH